MIQMKRPGGLPLATDPGLVDFLKCYRCPAHPAMTRSHYSRKAFGYSISQCYSNRKTLSKFSPSLLCPVKERKSTPAFTEDNRGRSPSLSLFSHLSETWPSFPTATDFVPSCEIHLEVQMEKIKTNRALIQVRAWIPLSQVIKRNSWLNYTTTNGFTPPTCLKDCQNQNLQKESSFPTLKPPPLETRLLLCE